MEAEQVIEKILSEAKAQAQKITDEANQAQIAEQAKFDAESALYNEQTETIAKKAGEDKKSHILASTRMMIAKENLVEKRAIIDNVFKQAKQKVQSLPDDQYKQLFTNLMIEAVETGDEEVVIDKNETRIDAGFISNVNSKLSQNGKKGTLKLTEEKQNIESGFVLKRGKIKNNASLPVLLEQARSELEIELSKELFL